MNFLYRFFIISILLFNVKSGTILSNDSQNALYIAQKMLDSISSPIKKENFITKNEWIELELNRLLFVCNRSLTALGPWALRELTFPTQDEAELKERQNQIRYLTENPHACMHIQYYLKNFAKDQNALFSYWEPRNYLFRSVERFYFSGIEKLAKQLNKYQFTLQGGYLLSFWHSVLGILRQLCMQGISNSIVNMLDDTSDYDFSLKSITQESFKSVKVNHSPYLETLKYKPNESGYSLSDFMRAGMIGSPGDMYHILTTGIKSNGMITPPTPKLLAFAFALIKPISYDIIWANEAYQSWTSAEQNVTLIKELQHNCVSISHLFNSIISLQKELSLHPPFAKIAQNIETLLNDPDITECIKLLQTKTFNSNASFFFLQGRVLRAHKQLMESKEKIIALLQQVAFVDAYSSLATLYLESQLNENKFSFVTYKKSETPVLEYKDAWLPMVINSKNVTNDIEFGVENNTTKMIITGPNGGGKSVYLKLVGICTLLAQSWTIVPATIGIQSIFAHIYTALNPAEDLSKGLSKFMSQKLSMMKLEDNIAKSSAQAKSVILSDEAYNGTVDDECADRIYEFGKKIADNPNVITILATHVKKPIELEKATNGIFKNYQVAIEPTSNGGFLRTFKLAAGPANWWFDDKNLRSRYIDWIADEILHAHMKENV